MLLNNNRYYKERAQVDSKPRTQRRVEDFMKACRRLGIKATHQRTEILRELAATEEHPDADTVYRRVRERIPSISLDTVYRTLRMLEEKKVISRVGFRGGSVRFDANTDRHHHFICTECGFVGDFYCDALDGFAAPPQAAALGEVDSVHVELWGRCRDCREKERRRR